MDLILTLNGNYRNWIDYADDLDSTDTDGSALAVQCVEFAMNKTGHPELDEVTIEVTNVNSGSVVIEYTLTCWNRDLLELAKTNIDDTVNGRLDNKKFTVPGTTDTYTLKSNQ